MHPNGVNGNIPAETPRVKKQQEVFNKTNDKNLLAKALAGLEREVKQAIQNAVADSIITENEYKELSSLQLIATKYLEKAGQLLPEAVDSAVTLYNKIAEVFQNKKYTVHKNVSNQTEANEKSQEEKDKEYLAETARSFGWECQDRYGNYRMLEPSDINGMHATVVGHPMLSPQEKVEIFETWLDIHKNDISEQDMNNHGIPKLKHLKNLVLVNKNLENADNKTAQSDTSKTRQKEQAAIMKKYGHRRNAEDDFMALGYTKQDVERIIKRKN